jgi:hypothetical protein
MPSHAYIMLTCDLLDPGHAFLGCQQYVPSILKISPVSSPKTQPLVPTAA